VAIERQLLENEALSYLYLPQANGGQLELVEEIVGETIADNQAAGLSIGSAQKDEANALQAAGQGRYRHAFQLFARAYRAAPGQ
jgi:hypothetical protein